MIGQYIRVAKPQIPQTRFSAIHVISVKGSPVCSTIHKSSVPGIMAELSRKYRLRPNDITSVTVPVVDDQP